MSGPFWYNVENNQNLTEVGNDWFGVERVSVTYKIDTLSKYQMTEPLVTLYDLF